MGEVINMLGFKDSKYVFTFGKYKGQRITEVIDNNPEYIEWCIREVKNFKLDEKLQEHYELMLDAFYDTFPEIGAFYD